ncbi:haloacid dehalogenase [Chloroflexota bacterium]
MSRLTENLDSIAARLRSSFSTKDAAREKALPLCREIIRCSSSAIRAIHRQECDWAKQLLGETRQLLNEAEQTLGGGDITNTGYLRDAQKEFVEASITLSLVVGEPPNDPDALGVGDAAYLNGLGEAVGELRRYLLDSMRRGDISRGEELLLAMDDIYSVLVAMDFPDAMTGGLRCTTDMVRGVLERTRSDLTLAMRQEELERKLEKLGEDNT